MVNWAEELKEKKSEAVQSLELTKREAQWKKGDSRDGYIETFRKRYTYKDVVFEIALLKYFTLAGPSRPTEFSTIGRGRLTAEHAVCEHPAETADFVQLAQSIGGSEVLYHDTLHSWNDNQTIEEQLEEMYQSAIRDIDRVFVGDEARNTIEKQIKGLQDVLKKIEELRRK